MSWFPSWRRWLKVQLETSQRRRQASARAKPYRRLRLEPLEDRLAPATHTWTGAANSLWSNNANWVGGSPMGDPNADLVFPPNSQNELTCTNDISGLTIRSITFSGDSYQISGTGIALNAGITVAVGVSQSLFLANIVLGAAQVFTVSGATLGVDGIISGGSTATLTKTGTGTLVMGRANSYSGGTILNAGGVELPNMGLTPLGTGMLTINGGVIEIAPGAGLRLGNPFIVGGPGRIEDFAGLTFTGNGILTKGNTLAVGSMGGGTTFSGVISGDGSLTADGAGTVTLGAANTYTGATTITSTLSSGTLRLATANAIPSASAVTVASLATLALNGFDDTIGSLSGSGSVTLGNGILTAGGDNTSTTFSG